MNQADFRAETPYASFGTTAIDAHRPMPLTFHSQDVHPPCSCDLCAWSRWSSCYFKTLPLDEWVPSLFSFRWGWMLLFLAATWS